MKRLGFPRSARLLRSADFDRVMKQRQSTSDGLIVLYGARNQCGRTRLGLVVSRKCGGAVIRNRWKRSLREAFRLVLSELPTDLDLVVLPRHGVTPHRQRLEESIKTLAAELECRLSEDETERS